MASQDWFDKDFYKVLGVSKDVTPAELKKAYRKLARKYHPDSNPGNPAAEAKFKEISEAHSVIGDSAQRKEYDAVRAMGGGARFTAPRPGGGQAGGFDDVFGGMFGGGARQQQQPGYSYEQGGFDDLLGGMFGRGQGGGGFGTSSGGFRGYGGPTRGRDVIASTTVDFITATHGDQITLQTQDGRAIKVKIPAGVADGQKIKLRGQGQHSPDGGESGDIVLTVNVRKHPVFERDGLNLRVSVPVTFVEAALGATIEVPTLGGAPVKLRIAPGTPSGRVLRVKGRGVVTPKGTGDLLAVVQVAVPSHLSKDAEEKLAAFAESLPKENPRDDLLAKARD
ncbi:MULTISPECIES: DnaJ C-terminal domain-containing protein [Cryobacterium]|uniref:J domain-containing protein n=1 Tax=Cryobacterium breve TaxID=1259258 RepID=A0ABY2J3K7_9MICO|nr:MULTISPECIES: DnaJ C-terminal domain-containing protein [Cryobacterium]TFC92413.1 J domain-containing protein [Cryobacterium sp. TmT3-12]TFC99516.1 J domain-containing protein [Cryobacterium breve]